MDSLHLAAGFPTDKVSSLSGQCRIDRDCLCTTFHHSGVILRRPHRRSTDEAHETRPALVWRDGSALRLGWASGPVCSWGSPSGYSFFEIIIELIRNSERLGLMVEKR